MIGYYNYTVILTFMSLVSALSGMVLAIDEMYLGAVFCLALSGFFDMLDGPVARTKTDRSNDERLFGIQLDSLCDLVAFGVLPAIICYKLGVGGPIGNIVIVFYVLCGTVRLCYFNVRETNSHFSEEVHEKVFIGLPITSIAVIFPLVFLLQTVLTQEAFCAALTLMLIIVGTLFIANFQLKKPSLKLLLVMCVIVAAAFILAVAIQFPHIEFLAI